jgi:hypothetical protein
LSNFVLPSPVNPWLLPFLLFDRSIAAQIQSQISNLLASPKLIFKLGEEGKIYEKFI